MTPSLDAPEVCAISDISSPDMDETEEYIQISNIEEKHCCTSMLTFTSDFSLNSVQNFPVIASESEEKFDFSLSNVASGVKMCNTLDILEEISYYQSDVRFLSFKQYDLRILSKRITCTSINTRDKRHKEFSSGKP